MSLQSVRDFFAARALDVGIVELDVSTATVALAAAAHGVEPGRIAKTLAFALGDGRNVLLVARGDARIHNQKFKATFGKGRRGGSPDGAPGGRCLSFRACAALAGVSRRFIAGL
jgi:prolyl-tRNA editing enzyme YbaK/EbsC (Cys-tRNA(Pro) deacylase)